MEIKKLLPSFLQAPAFSPLSKAQAETLSTDLNSTSKVSLLSLSSSKAECLKVLDRYVNPIVKVYRAGVFWSPCCQFVLLEMK